jgi:hypothetical protein
MELLMISNEEEAVAAAWSLNYFKQSLPSQFHPKLVTNQCAMERFILISLGLNLHKRGEEDRGSNNNYLDFKYTLNFLKKCIGIMLLSYAAAIVTLFLNNKQYLISIERQARHILAAKVNYK